MSMEQPKFDHLYVEDDLQVDGLSNKEALLRLIEDVESLAQEFKSKRTTWSHLKDIVHPFNQQSILNISSLVLLVISIVVLIATDLSIYSGLCLVLCVAASAGVNIWDNYCRHFEIYYRIQYVLGQLRECIQYKWTEHSYPHLYMPFSPCINLQWTYRQGGVVNVPWSLLVRGDFILLRPGQPAPAYCTKYQPKDNGINELKFGDIYNPCRSFNPRVPKPTARQPVENAVFVLQNTPYVRNLEGTLLQCVGKPVDYYTSTLYILNVKSLQYILYPLLFSLVILVNVVHSHVITSEDTAWFVLYLSEPLTITLPLLSAVLPTAWFLLNNYGNALLQSSYQQDFATNESCLDLKRIIKKKHILHLSSWSVLKDNLVSCLKGDGRFVTRTANLLHVLGSVSTICCVDKKGILSWPNPTAEKVFFLRSPNSNDVLDVREVSEEPTPIVTAKVTKDKPEEDKEEEQKPLLENDEHSKLNVKYRTQCDKASVHYVRLGSDLHPFRADFLPEDVLWKPERGAYYTLLHIGPNTNPMSHEINDPGYFLHFGKVNIQGSNWQESGHLLAEYIGPRPFPEYGRLAYTYLLYKQPSIIDFHETHDIDDYEKFRWDLRAFLNKHNITELVAGNFYTSEGTDDKLASLLTVEPGDDITVPPKMMRK